MSGDAHNEPSNFEKKETGQELFSVKEFLKKMGIKRTKFYKELNSGRLKATKVGSNTKISLKQAMEWIANLEPYVPMGKRIVGKRARRTSGGSGEKS